MFFKSIGGDGEHGGVLEAPGSIFSHVLRLRSVQG